ncbi:MAG: YggT family protein [Chloroflexota bacterium]
MNYRTDTEVVEPIDPVDPQYSQTTRVTRYSQGPAAVLEKLLMLIFGLIGLVIVLRIVLLLVAAREGNDLVQGIYNLSEILVAPFRGILRIDEVQAGISALDTGAIVALVGWLIIAVVLIAIVRMFRPTARA